MTQQQQYRTQEDQREADAWIREWGYFDFPSFCAPPVDLWDYTVADYKQKCRRVHQSTPLLKSEWYSLITITHSFFGWLHTPEGTGWLFKLFRIEEVPAHHGYRYYFNKTHLISEANESNLRIFIRHAIKRWQEPAYEEPGAIDQLKKIMRKAFIRKNCNPKFASDAMYRWVLTTIRNWFSEPVDKHFPFEKMDRVSGLQWAQAHKDPWSPNDTMWSAISETEKYHPRAYRIEQRGGVLWCGRGSITAEPLDKFLYKEGMRAVRAGAVNFGENGVIERISEDFKCSSCDRVVCCTSKSRGPRGEGEQLCDNCFGTQVETGDRDTLDNCTYAECYQCPNYIRDADDLKNLKRRMGAGYDEWPIKR